MVVGKVVGSIVSTRKSENLIGNKFMIIEPLQEMAAGAARFVAIDNIGAGIEEILRTFDGIARTVGAQEAVIGIKREYKAAVKAIETYIDAYPNMRIQLLDSVYPMGDEVVLIYEATGRVIRPGGLPIEEGVAVFNVETVYNAYRALERQTPVFDKLVSVVGAYRRVHWGHRGICGRNHGKGTGLSGGRAHDGEPGHGQRCGDQDHQRHHRAGQEPHPDTAQEQERGHRPEAGGLFLLPVRDMPQPLSPPCPGASHRAP